jgi:hypothetical protein
MRNTRSLAYKGYLITLRAVSDGRLFAAGYVVERPNNPVEPFSTLVSAGFPTLESALAEADLQARRFVDRMLADGRPETGDPAMPLQ